MARISIVTPAAANARNGNRHTAARWAAMLRSAGHRVSIAQNWGENGREGERCDLLIALHALYSHDSVLRYRAASEAPLIVTLPLLPPLPWIENVTSSIGMIQPAIVTGAGVSAAAYASTRR